MTPLEPFSIGARPGSVSGTIEADDPGGAVMTLTVRGQLDPAHPGVGRPGRVVSRRVVRVRGGALAGDLPDGGQQAGARHRAARHRARPGASARGHRDHVASGRRCHQRHCVVRRRAPGRGDGHRDRRDDDDRNRLVDRRNGRRVRVAQPRHAGAVHADREPRGIRRRVPQRHARERADRSRFQRHARQRDRIDQRPHQRCRRRPGGRDHRDRHRR